MFRFKNIGVRIAAVVFVLMLASISTMSVLSYFEARDAVESEIMENIQTISKSIASDIDSIVNGYYDTLGALAAYDRIQRVNDPEETQAQAESTRDNRERVLLMAQKVRENNPNILEIDVIRKDGVAFSTNGSVKKVSDMEYFKLAMQGKSSTSSPMQDNGLKMMVVIATIPIKGKDGTPIGAVSAIMPGDIFSKIISAVTIAQTGKPFMIDKAGFTIAHSNFKLVEERDNTSENVKKDPNLASLAEVEEHMVAGETGVGFYSYLGIKKFVGYAPVKEAGWSIAVQAPENEVFAGVNAMGINLIWITSLMVIVGSFIGWLSMRGFGIIMKEMAGHFGLIATGDISVDVPHRYMLRRDEVGIAANAVQKMLESFRYFIKTVDGAIQTLSSTAEEFSSQATESNTVVREVESNVKQVKEEMDSLAAAATQINSSIDEVSVGAHSLAERGTAIAAEVDGAHDAGLLGVSCVNRVVDAVNEVANDTMQSSNDIKELGDRARQIQGFVAQIGGIADQTNLLALNAAIEAARAGDAGRGFAVVADEVRKLAEDSNEAAKKIADLAGVITRDLDKVVESSERNAHDSENSSVLAKETENAIQKMMHALDSISSGTQDSAAVSQEQAASSAEISSVVQSIVNRVRQATDSTEKIHSQMGGITQGAVEMGEAAKNIATLAFELSGIVSKFKLGNETNAIVK